MDQISEKEEQLREVKDQMEQIRAEFVKKAGSFARGWFREKTVHYVKKYADRTEALSDKQLADLRAKSGQLAESADDLSREIFSRGELWWHLDETPPKNLDVDDDMRYWSGGARLPEQVELAMKELLGSLGTLLAGFGYLGGRITRQPREPSSSQKSGTSDACTYSLFWDFSLDCGGRTHGRPHYVHDENWPQDMLTLMSSYEELYKQGIEARLVGSPLARHRSESALSSAGFRSLSVAWPSSKAPLLNSLETAQCLFCAGVGGVGRDRKTFVISRCSHG
jgi:hypothetical protein